MIELQENILQSNAYYVPVSVLNYFTADASSTIIGAGASLGFSTSLFPLDVGSANTTSAFRLALAFSGNFDQANYADPNIGLLLGTYGAGDDSSGGGGGLSTSDILAIVFVPLLGGGGILVMAIAVIVLLTQHIQERKYQETDVEHESL